MSALGFVNPWTLLALPAVGLPVLIHFLTRARPRTIRYPTLRFLVEAGAGRQTLHRLRVIVLLALRCLAVAALALVFARPFLKRPGAETVPGARRRVVLLVDASMSMRAVRGGVSLFTRARAEAAEVLSGLEPGSQAAVIFFGRRPAAVLPAISANIEELHRALVLAGPTMECGRPELALAMAESMLSESGGGEVGGGEGHGSIYVFSDFQRTNWGAARPEDVRNATVFLRPVADRAAPNVAVTTVRMSPAEPVAGEPVELACTVFNCTGQRREETVGLVVEGEGVGFEARVALRPFRSGEAVFTFDLPRPGIFPGTVTLAARMAGAGPPKSADDLVEDNTRYFTVRVRTALEVLVVSDSDADDRTSAAFFVSTALSPTPRAGAGLSVSRRHSQDTDQAAIDQANVIVVASPATLPGRVAEAIARRVTGGGHLILVLDGPTSIGTLGALSSASAGAITPPFLLAQQAVFPEGQPLGEANLAAGVLDLFTDPAQGGLGGVLFRRRHRTVLSPDRKGEVLVYHSDGSAALALSPAGRGSAVFANFPATPDGGNLVGRGVFPALMAEIMRALRRGGDMREVSPGCAWEIDAPLGDRTASEETGYRVVAPPPERPGSVPGPADQEREVPFTAVTLGRFARLSLPPVPEPGHYPVFRAAQKGGPPAAVGVVNVDPRESDTRELPFSFPARAGGDGAVAVLEDEGELRVSGEVRSLWPALAGFAAAFIAAEMLLLVLWRRRPVLR
jgi:hypothetical protein